MRASNSNTQEEVRMSLKRLSISIAAAALLAIGVAACGGDDDQDGDRHGHPPTAARDAAATPARRSSIIASVPPTDHGWLGAISKNAKAAADAVRRRQLRAAPGG